MATQSIKRTKGSTVEWLVGISDPAPWEAVYTGSAQVYADEAAADAELSTMLQDTSYVYSRSNPPGGPRRPH